MEPAAPDYEKIAASVTGVASDSRKVRPGYAFVAIPGVRDDGSKYIADAIGRGARVVLAGRDACSAASRGAGRGVAFIPSPASPDGPRGDAPALRLALAELSCAFYGHPSRSLAVYGVTGTNGKTTVAGLVRDLLEARGRPCGLLSTVEYAWPGHREEAARTTPDPVAAQRSLAEMHAAGCAAASMEASSHALDQGRVAGIRFAACGFTNLSQDHFDYHRGFEDYFACKRRLFEQLGRENPGAPAVVNADDPYGRRLLADVPALGARAVPYSVEGEAEVCAAGVRLGAGGTVFTLRAFGRSAEIHTGLVGRYNVSNALCAAGMALATGVPFEAVAETLSAAKPRWGRLEKIEAPGGAQVFVDYAHSPDAIEKALGALREVTQGRLTIVFGCGGDRDRAKRPLMAAAAARLADRVVLTSDNPRNEDPEAILDGVEAGLRGSATPHVRIADRRDAIAEALRGIGRGDVVLVAGKGHETCQIVGGERLRFDDRETVRALLCARRPFVVE